MASTAKVISSNGILGGLKIVSESTLYNQVKKLSRILKERLESPKSNQLNAEWTKIAIVVPLLEGLGWDKSADIYYKYGLHSSDGRLDLILNCQTPIGIQIRTPHELPPRNIEHPQIKNGFSLCKANNIPYFIWTNGDSWQFFSLASMNAQRYHVCLSDINNNNSLLYHLLIIKKDVLISHPEKFKNALNENVKRTALPHASIAVLHNHKRERLQVFHKGQQNFDIKEETNLKSMKTLSSEGLLPYARPSIWVPKPRNWEKLIDSYESPYRLARWFFRTSYYRKLGEYIINKNYKPWPKESSWRHVGFPDGLNERRKAEHAVLMFREWGFIREASDNKYYRIDECIPYLKKVLERNTLP